ncbi:transmembrane protein 275-like [Tachysurus ichikawai]
MICFKRDPHPSVVKKKRSLRPHRHPSPALCCACGLCLMLAGINITLVGAFGFGKILPATNPPIIIGPLLLLVALSFFAVCCMFSRQPSTQFSHANARPNHWGLMGGTAFEMETSENTLQDTTAIQLSPTNSQCSSHQSSPNHLPAVMPHQSDTANLANGSHSLGQLSPREDDMVPLSSYDERYT